MATRKSAISVIRFEIVGLDKETRNRWKSLAQLVKRVTNCFWRWWLVLHTQAGNSQRVRDYLLELQAWHEAGGQGACPVCEVQCLTNEMTAAIRAEVKSEYPEVNHRCIGLVLQNLGRRAFRMKSGKGAVPRWMRIVADDGEYPSSSKPLPIPFDPSNSRIIVPEEDGKCFCLQLRLDRVERSGMKYATSTKDVCRLLSNDQTPLLWQIVNDELSFVGSNLVYVESKNKWFAHIYYQEKKKGPTKELESGRIAFLRPAKGRPWWLRVDGYHHYVGGRDGRHVAYVREQLMTERLGRNESYRHASSARRGHGRERAMGRTQLLRTRWKDFVKTANQRLAQQVMAMCVEHKCGRLVYFLPDGAARENRFLHTAGKKPEQQDNSSWDWRQVRRFLSHKCDQLGIEFEVRTMGVPRDPPHSKTDSAD